MCCPWTDVAQFLSALRYLWCCCRRGKSLSPRILEDQFTSPCHWTTSPCPWTTSPCHWTTSPCPWTTSPCHWTTSPCPWTTKSLKTVKYSAFCKLSVMYDHVKSINSVLEVTVKNGLLTVIRYYSSAIKPFFIVTLCC